LTHTAPPEPHALLMKPASQSPCVSQQPAQFDASHFGGGGTHALLVHTSLIAVQLVQDAPPLPQIASLVPALHLPLASQHPLQFDGPQGGVVHAPLAHTSPIAVQFEHAFPPAPHAVSCEPTAQTPLMQQPFAHVVGPHVGSQKPLMHWAFAPHDWHTAPPLPHAVPAPPATHVFPWQHPVQFVGSHVAFWTHLPAVHWVAPVHVAHAAPFVPQSKSSLPGKQSLPTQHPVQLVALHVVAVWHTLPTHFARGPQAMHARPPKPHCVSEFPVMQTSPWQQPVHVDGSHFVELTHAPFTHVCPAAQTWQRLPAAPHAPTVPPSSQRPFTSQHPLQLPGPHATVAHVPPPALVARHCCVVGSHVAHWAPPKPHSFASVPVWHELPAQQPVQFDGPHFVAVHTPPALGDAAQVNLLAAQFWHDWPNCPHAVSDVPSTHSPVSGTQQPLQFPGPHPLAPTQTRLPLSQVPPPAVQSTHDSAPLPHAFAANPLTHVPSGWQHPPEQFSTVHVPAAGVHELVLASHVVLSKHGKHATPRAPHASFVVPPTHLPWSQHPAHVAGPHVPASLPGGCPVSGVPPSWVTRYVSSSRPDRPQPARAKTRPTREKRSARRAVVAASMIRNGIRGRARWGPRRVPSRRASGRGTEGPCPLP
jgi:hypothetical protein